MICGENGMAAGAKQAAERGLFPSNKHKKHTAEAKARRFLLSICGTTEVVP
jgi:hypothetical protein